MNVMGVIMTYVLTDLVGLLPFVPAVFSAYAGLRGGGDRGRMSLWSVIRKHGKWAIAQGYMHHLVQGGRIWFIKLILGTEAVGLFSAAYGMYQHVVGTMPLKLVLSSIIPQHDPHSVIFRKLVVKGVKYNVLGTGVLALIGAVLVPVLIMVLLPEYMAAILLFELMLLSMLPAAVSGVFTVIFYALRQQKSVFWANLAVTLVAFVSLPIFLAVFGIYGVAFELVLTTTLFALERYGRTRAVLPDVELPWRAFFTYDEFDRTIVRKLLQRIPGARIFRRQGATLSNEITAVRRSSDG